MLTTQGGVAKWMKATVCKTVIPGSNPGAASNSDRAETRGFSSVFAPFPLASSSLSESPFCVPKRPEIAVKIRSRCRKRSVVPAGAGVVVEVDAVKVHYPSRPGRLTSIRQTPVAPGRPYCGRRVPVVEFGSSAEQMQELRPQTASQSHCPVRRWKLTGDKALTDSADGLCCLRWCGPRCLEGPGRSLPRRRVLRPRRPFLRPCPCTPRTMPPPRRVWSRSL